MKKYTSLDEYFADFSGIHFEKLMEMRTIIASVIPNAQEVISYNMPAFKTAHVVVYYAAAKKHIGFYPTGIGVEQFLSELNEYKTTKGAIQFPLNQPLPSKLIQKITLFRAEHVAAGNR